MKKINSKNNNSNICSKKKTHYPLMRNITLKYQKINERILKEVIEKMK